MESCALTHIALIVVLFIVLLRQQLRHHIHLLISKDQKKSREKLGKRKREKMKGRVREMECLGQVQWIVMLDRLFGFEEGMVRGGQVKYLALITFLLLILLLLVQELPLSFTERKFPTSNCLFFSFYHIYYSYSIIHITLS